MKRGSRCGSWGAKYPRLRAATAAAALVLLSGCDAAVSPAADESEALQEFDAGAAPPVSAEGGSVEKAVSAVPGAPAEAQLPRDMSSPMLIRTGQAMIEVDSLELAVASARALASRLGGYVASATFHAGEHRVAGAQLELRLPADRFDEAVSGLEPLGEVQSVQLQSQDVGEEFVDLSARLVNARRLEQRLLEILATRAGRLEEVLAVERELARVREEIERMQGRLRHLEARVAMSTLAIDVREPAPILAAPGNYVLVRALHEAWANFVGLLATFIASLGLLVPLGAIGAAAWLAGRRVLARRRPTADPAA